MKKKHINVNPGIIRSYQESRHAEKGISWSECHIVIAGDHAPPAIPGTSSALKRRESRIPAVCHMSGFGGVVETTHDVGERLY